MSALANAYVRAPARPAALRMFCFHHAGGGASLYRGWQRAIGPHVAVCPVLLPGREGRAAEPRFTELDALVADLDAELGDLLAEPHVLFGHSMGALVAYRLACHRRACRESLPRALLLSSYPAPHLAAPMPAVDDRDDDALVGLLTGTGGLAPELRDWPGGVTELLAVARDDLRLCASDGHRDRGEAPLPCPDPHVRIRRRRARQRAGPAGLGPACLVARRAACPVGRSLLPPRRSRAAAGARARAAAPLPVGRVGVVLADAKECAVWWAAAGCAGPALAALLPAAERERAGRLRREVDRDRTIVAWALRPDAAR